MSLSGRRNSLNVPVQFVSGISVYYLNITTSITFSCLGYVDAQFKLIS